MCKSEIFAETINLVAQETEIPASRILSSDYFPEYPVYNERRDSQPYGDDMGERRRRRANGEFM